MREKAHGFVPEVINDIQKALSVNQLSLEFKLSVIISEFHIGSGNHY